MLGVMLDQIFTEQFEQVSIFSDKKTGLECIIAIHSTKRGPALGGCRFRSYAGYSDALFDVLRLAKGMTLKAACAELDLGGGKSVIVRDPNRTYDRRALMEAFARCVEQLNGRYITAEDMGTTAEDMDIIAEITNHVRGRATVNGDPSPYTARGVYNGILAGFEVLYGDRSVAGRVIAIQGLGAVGFKLAKLLAENGANIIGADINPTLVERASREIPNFTPVDPSKILFTEADCLSPCAGGGVLNPSVLETVKAPLIAGAANNQLSGPECYPVLKDRKLLYAPDFVINAGGLIKVASEGMQDAENWVSEKIEAITDRVLAIFNEHHSTGKSTEEIAYQMAASRLGD